MSTPARLAGQASTAHDPGRPCRGSCALIYARSHRPVPRGEVQSTVIHLFGPLTPPLPHGVGPEVARGDYSDAAMPPVKGVSHLKTPSRT